MIQANRIKVEEAKLDGIQEIEAVGKLVQMNVKKADDTKYQSPSIDESWSKIEVYHPDEPESIELKEKLCSNKDGLIKEMVSKREYLSNLTFQNRDLYFIIKFIFISFRNRPFDGTFKASLDDILRLPLPTMIMAFMTNSKFYLSIESY